MSKYLIEVSHGKGSRACADAINTFLHSGSHFMVNADWGCKDDVHKAWLIVEADNKEELKMIVPPAFRNSIRITELTKYTTEEISEMVDRHGR